MRVAVFSNAPWAPTGYGTQTKQLTDRLVKDGHDVGVIANWGLTGAPQSHAGMTVFPQGQHAYSLDSADFYADFFMEGGDGIVLVLYDTWPLLELPTLFAKHRTYYWCPVDHSPPPPKVIEWTKTHDTIAMAKWGQVQLAMNGVSADYIPHAIESSIFHPVESGIRDIIRIPADAHLTMINAANIGQTPPRKRFFENMMAWRLFADEHPDAYLYIHTQLRHSRGVDLASCIVAWGLPQDRIRIVDQGAHNAGFVTQDDLAAMYTASDVLLMATAGEGFGIPTIEAQACGTPVIVTDFSAQSELVGAGWKVPYITDWDYFQMSAHALPDVRAIQAALEESYAASKDKAQRDAMSAAAIAKAAEYDADKVYDEYWRPFLDSRFTAPEPLKLNRQQRRAKRAA
jgi:glycosyltransferase involved in cell wall biosynthesis